VRKSLRFVIPLPSPVVASHPILFTYNAFRCIPGSIIMRQTNETVSKDDVAFDGEKETVPSESKA
jgi:hypothetical protein